MENNCEHEWKEKTGLAKDIRVCIKCCRGDFRIDGEWVFQSYVRQGLIDLLIATEKLEEAVKKGWGNSEEVLKLSIETRNIAESLVKKE